MPPDRTEDDAHDNVNVPATVTTTVENEELELETHRPPPLQKRDPTSLDRKPYVAGPILVRPHTNDMIPPPISPAERVDSTRVNVQAADEWLDATASPPEPRSMSTPLAASIPVADTKPLPARDTPLPSVQPAGGYAETYTPQRQPIAPQPVLLPATAPVQAIDPNARFGPIALLAALALGVALGLVLGLVLARVVYAPVSIPVTPPSRVESVP
jgi:hypothetical protein